MRPSRAAVFYTLSAIGLALVAWVSLTGEPGVGGVESSDGLFQALLISGAVLLGAQAIRKLLARRGDRHVDER
ncbi:MAG: hypothetical protein ACR2FJ_10135 [Qipengyuania sp.]